MTAAPLSTLDLVVAIATAGSWVYAGILAAPRTLSGRRALLVLGMISIGILGVIAHGLTVIALGSHGWWFVQEQVVFALPLLLAALIVAFIVAVPALVRVARGSSTPLRPTAPTALLVVGYAAAAGIIARSIVGFPMTLAPAIVLAALVVLGGVLSYAIIAHRPRRVATASGALASLVLVSAIGISWLSDVATPTSYAAPHAHGVSAAAAVPADTGSDTVSVTDLRTPADAAGPVRRFTLTASEDDVELASGRTVSAWSFGSLPGPELRVTQGDLVEVTLKNRDVAAGVTLHWHGYDVPNGEDGVAGVTQDAVAPGGSFTYRFVADEPGTYWYHTHQAASDGVVRGLYGALIVEPAGGISEDADIVLAAHTQGGTAILGDSDRPVAQVQPEGTSVRVRLINTDQQPKHFRVTGTAFTVVAVDGRDLNGPTAVRDVALPVPAGGRIDVSFVMPDAPVSIAAEGAASATLTLSPDGRMPAPTVPTPVPELDLLSYGSADGAADATDARGPRVEAALVLDRAPRFLNGIPAYGYTVNGAVAPHIPSVVVSEGDVLRLTVVNRGWETHPMHVHGHHVRVISRDGVEATGSPLLLDTFDVRPGEVWVVELVADNPGIWMDHCHNLEHAAEGMMFSLAYRGVSTPFSHGGEHGNRSE